MPRFVNDNILIIQLIMPLDVNECQDGTSTCHANANCSNTVGSYNCSCLPGYSGNGFICEGTII